MPRAGVTKEKVFAAAAELADRDGYAAVSLAAIAAHFGIRTPSLYKHIKNLEEVQEHLALLGYQGLLDAVRARVGDGSGIERLRAFAHAYRDFARRCPGLYAAAQPTHLSRGAAVQAVAREILNEVFAVLRENSVPEDELVHAARTLRSAVHGFVELELAGGFGLPEDLEVSFEYLLRRFASGRGR